MKTQIKIITGFSLEGIKQIVNNYLKSFKEFEFRIQFSIQVQTHIAYLHYKI